MFLLNTDQSTEWEVLNATLPIPLQAQAGVLLGDTLLCMGGLDINDLGVTALHIINSTSQLATEGAPLPVDGYNGCAVEH